MKRDWLIHREEPGDEEALSRATALANLASADTIQSLIELLAIMNRLGGQAYIQAVRQKFTYAGEAIPEDETDKVKGEWFTRGYQVSYDSRDVRVEFVPAPDAVKVDEEAMPQ